MIILAAYKDPCNQNEILRDYQIKLVQSAYAVLHKFNLVYIAAETRTGKTLMSMALAQDAKVSRVLFVTKKKAIKSIENDFKLLKPNFSITITNYESLHKLPGDIEHDLIVVDEAHTLGGFPDLSKRTVSLRGLCKNKPIIFLSATPTPESFSSLYHELWISSFSPWARYTDFKKWAKSYVKVRRKRLPTHFFIDYSGAKKSKVLKDLAPLRVSLTQKEAGFRFNVSERVIQCVVPEDIKNYFDDLTKNKFLIIDDQDITADSPAKKKSKAHQLSSGSLITDRRDYLVLSTYKAERLKRLIEEKQIKKSVVFYKYKSELGLLQSYFYNIITDSPEEFQEQTVSMYAAQYLSGREGTRLDTAESIFFYSPDFAFLSYEQAKNRMQDMTRSETPTLYWLLGLPIDKSIMETVKGKKDYTASHFKREFLKK